MSAAWPNTFYKYATASTARLVLQNRTLRWSTPALFNDPYDTQFDLHIDFDPNEARRLSLEKLWDAWYGEEPYNPAPGNKLGQVIAQYRDKFPKMTREQFALEMAPGIEKGLSAGLQALPKLQEDMRAHMARSKILCQSSVPDSLLMWSYYADNHRGAVMCFKPPPFLNSPWHLARPVFYSPKMPRMGDAQYFSDLNAGLVSLDPKVLVDRIIYTKAAEWSHEQEWRLQAGSGRNAAAPFEDISFHPLELNAVILGCVMAPPDRAALTEIVRAKYPHASVLAARKHDREFRLIIEPVR